MGLEIWSAKATMSSAKRSVSRPRAPVSPMTMTSTSGSASIRSKTRLAVLDRIGDEELGPVVDRVVHREVVGDHLPQRVAGLLGQDGNGDARGLGHLGHEGARTTGDGIETAVRSGAGRQLGEEGGRLQQLVEVGDAGHPVLVEEAVDHGVGTGQVPGVGGGHAGAGRGGPHLEGHHRLALGVGRFQGPAQLGRVAEALEVAGDDGGVVVVGVVLDEVGRFQVELVAGGDPAGEGDAELGALDEGTALVARLGHQADAAAAAGGRLGQDFEGVGVGVGSEDADPVAGRHLAHFTFEGRTLLAHLGETGGEDEDVGHAVLAALLHHLGHDAGADVDDGQGDLGRDVGDVLVDGDVADRAALGVHQVPGVTPALAVGAPDPGRVGVAVDRTHDGHGLRVEELLEVRPLLPHDLSPRLLRSLSRPASRPSGPRSRACW